MHQLTMPTEQCVGLDKEPRELRSGNQSAEAGKERTIRWSQSRSGHLPSEDCHLVAEHDDFDRQLLIAPTQEPEQLKHADKGKIEEREGHGPFSPSPSLWRKAQFTSLDEILGTHSLRHPPDGRF
jgi:hypothetical protein